MAGLEEVPEVSNGRRSVAQEEGKNLLGVIAVCGVVLGLGRIGLFGCDDEDEQITRSREREVLLFGSSTGRHGVHLEQPSIGDRGFANSFFNITSQIDELRNGG